MSLKQTTPHSITNFCKQLRSKARVFSSGSRLVIWLRTIAIIEKMWLELYGQAVPIIQYWYISYLTENLLSKCQNWPTQYLGDIRDTINDLKVDTLINTIKQEQASYAADMENGLSTQYFATITIDLLENACDM